jgi:dephospho-CoA kinase
MHSGSRVVIGIGGKIGAGKTMVGRIFGELGAQYISADEIGWDVLSEIGEALQAKFGEAIMSGKRIDKKKLRELVFMDPEKLRFLNRASHPVLIRRIIEKIEAVRSGMVVIDAALLFDWPEVYEAVDYAVLVRAKFELMLSRARAKGLSEELFERILSMQKDDEETQGMASYVIENNGTMDELREKCRQIYAEISHDC